MDERPTLAMRMDYELTGIRNRLVHGFIYIRIGVTNKRKVLTFELINVVGVTSGGGHQIGKVTRVCVYVTRLPIWNLYFCPESIAFSDNIPINCIDANRFILSFQILVGRKEANIIIIMSLVVIV